MSVAKWENDGGDKIFRYNYDLNENSIVFDCGGYKGEWAEEIIKLYNPHIYIFEPMPKYYNNLVNKFAFNNKVSVYGFGLSDKNEKIKMAMLDNASTIYKKEAKDFVQVKMVDILDFLKKENISNIDLIKINIEGGEYSLLERMIQGDVVKNCSNIQAQFHKFMPNAEIRRETIRKSLAKTHFTTYNYPFVWENWRKNNFI